MTTESAGRPQRSTCLSTNRYVARIVGKSDPDEYLDKFESHMQDELTKTLQNVGIHALVKRDKFSLPYEHEMIVKLQFESFLNAALNYRRAFRIFVRELLVKDIAKIRFYLWTDVYEDGAVSHRYKTNSGIKYVFRYFVHEKYTPRPTHE